eukprot:TRINITY_DN42951_c0_g1_i1.p1 TRINITY_DN42951_c0_g1~~TRINITY_DN42951_c0_g1_i1.p1  ORF type:complete len:511 (+),score=84.20 TRINITY_DN42951_c0_g1_i1:35-1534(+)
MSYGALNLVFQLADTQTQAQRLSFEGLDNLANALRKVDSKIPTYNFLPGTGHKVCVTGASGFIASHLVAQLLARGYTVVGTVRNLGNAAKLSHLRSLPGASERLTLLPASLNEWGSFDKAIGQCEGVFHTASPFFLSTATDPERELIQPAYDGTLNVLESCNRAPSVTRVVVTSSTAAVIAVERPPGHVWSEQDWSDMDRLEKRKAWYPLSKTKAERAAWQFMQITRPPPRFSLATVNPTMVVGPMLQGELNASSEYLLSFLNGSKSEIPNSAMSFVDVRDVAKAHILAYEKREAEGRHLCVAQSLTSAHICAILSRLCPEARVPSNRAAGDPEAPSRYNQTKAKALGITFRSMVESFADSVESLRQHGFLPFGGSANKSINSSKSSPSKQKGGLEMGAVVPRPAAKVEARPAYARHDVSQALTTEDELRDLFNTWDLDNSGYISKDEFKAFYKSLDNLGVVETDDEVDRMLSRYSVQFEDNKLSFDEFAIIMLHVAQR